MVLVLPCGRENKPVVSPSLSTRRPSSASKSLAEQFLPIVTIHEMLRERATVALDVASELRKHSEAVAKKFVSMFMREIWKPFEDEGAPETDLPAVRDAVERLRPLASDALLAIFARQMTMQIEAAFGDAAERSVPAAR